MARIRYGNSVRLSASPSVTFADYQSVKVPHPNHDTINESSTHWTADLYSASRTRSGIDFPTVRLGRRSTLYVARLVA